MAIVGGTGTFGSGSINLGKPQPGGPIMGGGLGDPRGGLGPGLKGPYTLGGNQQPKPVIPHPQPQQPTVLGSETVRSSGQGPFDASYRQNLATYGGGQFSRPNGMFSFNPTSSSFPGQPTGGGNAPVMGSPMDLLTQALGGQGFGAPQPSQPVARQGGSWQQWLDQWRRQGTNLRAPMPQF